jgi:hypothetical protein
MHALERWDDFEAELMDMLTADHLSWELFRDALDLCLDSGKVDTAKRAFMGFQAAHLSSSNPLLASTSSNEPITAADFSNEPITAADFSSGPITAVDFWCSRQSKCMKPKTGGC